MHASPLEASAERLSEVLGAACDAGHGPSCIERAQLLLYAPGLARDEQRAHELAERACALRDPVGCLTAGRHELDPTRLAHGSTAPEAVPSIERALQLAREACEKQNSGKGCALASMPMPGSRISEAERARYGERAATLLEAACKAGEIPACMQAALQVAGARGDGDPVRIKAILEDGCAIGAVEACVQLAVNLPKGQAALKETLYRRACDKGSDEACIILARAERDGIVAASDPSGGKALFEKGASLAKARCDLALDRSCSVLAKSLALGFFADERAIQTITYLRGVCDRRSPMVCNDLAEAMSEGPEAIRDRALIERLKAQSCDFGYPFACPDPMAKLGIYVPVPAPIVDRVSWLEWAPRSAEPKAAQACGDGFHEATPAEVATLLASPGVERPFAKNASPCVRPVKKGTRPQRPVLTLAMSGANLDYALRDAKNKVLDAATIVRPSEAGTWAGGWKFERAGGPVDVDVDASVDWALASRFLREAIRAGLGVNRVWIEASQK